MVSCTAGSRSQQECYKTVKIPISIQYLFELQPSKYPKPVNPINRSWTPEPKSSCQAQRKRKRKEKYEKKKEKERKRKKRRAKRKQKWRGSQLVTKPLFSQPKNIHHTTVARMLWLVRRQWSSYDTQSNSKY